MDPAPGGLVADAAALRRGGGGGRDIGGAVAATLAQLPAVWVIGAVLALTALAAALTLAALTALRRRDLTS